jgi:transposase-like protein
MSNSFLYSKWFHDEPAAYRWVEAHIWPRGPVCPHCGGAASISKMRGKSTRIGTYKCYQCRKPFTVKIGTILEGSHLPLNLWLQAIHLIRQSKIGSAQLVVTLGIAPRTTKYVLRRLRVVDRDKSRSAKKEANGSGHRPRGQGATFIATARQHGANGSAKDLEKAFMKLVRPKRMVSSVAQRRRRVPLGSGREAARYP